MRKNGRVLRFCVAALLPALMLMGGPISARSYVKTSGNSKHNAGSRLDYTAKFYKKTRQMGLVADVDLDIKFFNRKKKLITADFRIGNYNRYPSDSSGTLSKVSKLHVNNSAKWAMKSKVYLLGKKLYDENKKNLRVSGKLKKSFKLKKFKRFYRKDFITVTIPIWGGLSAYAVVGGGIQFAVIPEISVEMNRIDAAVRPDMSIKVYLEAGLDFIKLLRGGVGGEVVPFSGGTGLKVTAHIGNRYAKFRSYIELEIMKGKFYVFAERKRIFKKGWKRFFSKTLFSFSGKKIKKNGATLYTYKW